MGVHGEALCVLAVLYCFAPRIKMFLPLIRGIQFHDNRCFSSIWLEVWMHHTMPKCITWDQYACCKLAIGWTIYHLWRISIENILKIVFSYLANFFCIRLFLYFIWFKDKAVCYPNISHKHVGNCNCMGWTCSKNSFPSTSYLDVKFHSLEYRKNKW